MKAILLSVISLFVLGVALQPAAEAQSPKGGRRMGDSGRGGSKATTPPPVNTGGVRPPAAPPKTGTAPKGTTSTTGGTATNSTTKTGTDTKGGSTNSGGIIVQGGAGGSASGPGSKGGAGGDAILVMGNNNTVINGNVTYVVGSTGRKGGSGGGARSFAGAGVAAGPVVSSPVTSDAAFLANTSVVAGANGTATTTAAAADTTDTAAPAPAPAEQTERHLELHNQSGEKLKVWLVFRTLGADNVWKWVPADPKAPEKAMALELEPGQKGFVKQDGKKITASRVRLWARSATGQWLEFKDEDLWLVPEKAKDGSHRYQADEVKAFTFVFPKPAGDK